MTVRKLNFSAQHRSKNSTLDLQRRALDIQLSSAEYKNRL